MTRELRSRLSVGKNEMIEYSGDSTRRGTMLKPEYTPVRAKRAKVESVIRITRSREPQMTERSLVKPPSPQLWVDES